MICVCPNCNKQFNSYHYPCDKITHVCEIIEKDTTIHVSPSISQKTINFGQALINHAITGFKSANEEQIQERYSVCKSCEFFKKVDENKGTCTHSKCGCNIKNNTDILNKLSWADQECPIGKWQKIE